MPPQGASDGGLKSFLCVLVMLSMFIVLLVFSRFFSSFFGYLVGYVTGCL